MLVRTARASAAIVVAAALAATLVGHVIDLERSAATPMLATAGEATPIAALGTSGATMAGVSSFADVPSGAWFHDPVHWLVDRGITSGCTTTLFCPSASTTRAHAVTFLHRLAGAPASPLAAAFADVPTSSYAAVPARWARAVGITNGVSGSERFEPNRPVTRAEVVAFLHRFAGSPTPAAAPPFPDVAPTSWYAPAVSWAAEHGITNGVGGTGRFEPDRTITRAEVAAFVQRYATTPAAAGAQAIAVAAEQVATQSAPVTGTSYFVDSATGDDAAPGTSSTTPWRTIDRVNRATFAPGDAVHFKRGSTWSQPLVVDSNGTSAAPITYLAYGSGAAPTIDNAALGTAIEVRGSWNVVRDFRLANVFYTGIEVFGSDNVARDNEIVATGSGMWLKGPRNLATHNSVHDLKMVVNTSGGDDDYGAVGFWVQAADNEISYNRCERCQAPSLDYGTDGGFVEIWQNGDRLDVHHNAAVDTDGFLEVGGRGSGASAVGIRLAYNLLVRTRVSMCLHHDWMPIDQVTFDNNTLIGPNRVACVSPSYAGFHSSILTMRNNIFSGAGTIAAFPFAHSHNLYTGDPGYSLGAGERIADPQFQNAGAGDYHLRSTSPALGAGLDLGASTDLDGTAVGSPPDLGVFEG